MSAVAKRGRPKGSGTGPTGPRKGSQTDWLASFAMGETPWIEADMKRKATLHNKPPISYRRSDGFTFTAIKYCAVPQSNLASEPIYMWRITRTA